MELKKGKIYRNKANKMVFIVLAEDEYKYTCISSTGDYVNISKSHIPDCSSARNVEEREKLFEFYKYYKEFLKAQAVVDKIKFEMDKKRNIISQYYSSYQFARELENAVECGYREKNGDNYISATANIFHEKHGIYMFKVDVSIYKEIARYPKPEMFDFIYMEYDRTLMLIENPEESKTYKRILQENQFFDKKEYFKKKYLNSDSRDIRIGDKTLDYVQTLSFMIETDLKKSSVKQAAKKIV